jgi:methionyl-tRNA formyltransferase
LARALFIGTRSPLAAGALSGWLASGNEVAEFWSDAPGVKPERFGAPRLSPAGLIARHRIKNLTVPWLSRWPGLMDAVEASGADLLITCATHMIVPDVLLARFGGRAVNLHPALLPEYRGPSPYLPMLLDGRGDSDGGTTLHVLSSGIDEGDIIAQEAVPYSAAGGRFPSWYAALVGASYRLMRDELPRYLSGELVARPQVGGSYAKLQQPHVIEPGLGAARVGQMLDRAGSTFQLAVAFPDRKREIRVTRLLRSAPRTGEPARLRALSIEMDFADARLTLRRATGLERRLTQWQLARALKPLQL